MIMKMVLLNVKYESLWDNLSMSDIIPIKGEVHMISLKSHYKA